MTTGLAGTRINVEDFSNLLNSKPKGIIALLGETQWGKVNTPTVVASWPDYVKKFGGLISGSTFPALCKRMLDYGARIMVSRIEHYTDITDKQTLVAVAASGTLGTDVTVDANFVGTWGNLVTVTALSPLSKDATKVDIEVKISGFSTLTWVYRDFPTSPSAADIAAFNLASYYVKFTDEGSAAVAANDTETLTSGTDDINNIDDADYIGDSTQQLGIHSYDNEVNYEIIAAPHKSSPAIDAALISYAETAQDIAAWTRSPHSISAAVMGDYRNGENSYSHTAFNSWHHRLFGGGLVQRDANGNPENISELADALALYSVNRNNFDTEFFLASGSKRGKIKNALGVVTNFGSPANKANGDFLDAIGYNLVIDHAKHGTVVWGDKTTYQTSSLLQIASVAQNIILLLRDLKDVTDSEQFDPNDIETWKTIYRKVTQVTNDRVARRAFYDIVYVGDQDIDNIEEAVVNDLDAAPQTYSFKLFTKPTPALKYIRIGTIVSNAGTDFDILETDTIG